MIRDGELMLCDGQSLANAIGTFLSETSYDAGTVDTMVAAFQTRGAVPHDVGKGRTVYLCCQITADVDSAGHASTLKVELVTADDDALTVNLTSLGISGAALAQAVLVAGKKFSFPVTLPPGGTQEFYGLRFTVAGEAITTGTIDAWLSMSPLPG